MGNYDIKLETEAADETGQLIRSFNSMILDLKEQETRVRRFTNELKSKNMNWIEEELHSNSSKYFCRCDFDRSSLNVTSINSAAIALLSLDKDLELNRNYERP